MRVGLNKQTIIGNISKDPSFGESANGRPYIRFDVVVPVTGSDEADFFHCLLSGPREEALRPFFTRKRLVYVAGPNRQKKYQAQDGSERMGNTILVDEFKFLDYKPEENSTNDETTDEAGVPGWNL